MSPLIILLVLLVVAGLVLYIIPMDPTIKALFVKVVVVIVCVCLLLWVLSVFGILPAGALHLRA